MDNLEFLDGSEEPKGEVVSEAPAVEAPVAEAPVEAPEGPSRDERGRFASKQPEPAEAAPVVAAEPEKPAVPPGMVPVSVLQELREELKALKTAPPVQQPPAQPQHMPQAPDPLEDPEGYQQYQNFIRMNDRLDFSEEMARQNSGDELVGEAQEWAKQQMVKNPAFHGQLVSQRHPYGWLVKEYQRQQSLSKIGDDPKEIEAYLAWKQAQALLATQPAATPTPTPTPTQSIASAPSAGGHQQIATGPGVAFDNMLG